MSAKELSSRAIVGEFYKALEQATGASWLGAITNLFQSDQESESYKWLGMTPVMREWIGGRNAKGFRTNGITIENKHYEATMDVLVKEMRRDKTGQIMVRIRELAQRTQAHWNKLVSTLILNGESTVCYDGQYFFDTDHSEGDSGTQSNDIDVDISALPSTVAGTTTAPSVEEAQGVIATGIQQMLTFVDDQGEPMNEEATQFVVMVPVALHNVFKQAVATPVQVSASQTALTALQDDFNIVVVTNARLTWTDKIAIFRADSAVKPFIRQEETDVTLKVKAEGSEYEMDNDAHQYGVDTWRNAGYGLWQHAVLATMV